MDPGPVHRPRKEVVSFMGKHHKKVTPTGRLVAALHVTTYALGMAVLARVVFRKVRRVVD